MSDEVEGESVEVSEKVAELMEMEEGEREEYCRGVIRAVVGGLKEILGLKSKFAQAKALKEYMAELREQMPEIRVVVFYTIKPEFREVYQGLLETFSGVSL